MLEATALGDLIDGNFVGAPEDDAGVVIESRDPAHGFRPIFRVTTRVEHVGVAVGAARKAQRAWFACGTDTRIAHLQRLKAVFAAHCEELARAIVLETGKPHREALGEAASLGARVDLMVKDGLARIETLRPEGVNGEARYHPQGVLVVVGPYNYPAHLLNAHVIPALLTGNTVVIKPTEHCPWVGQLYAQCFAEAGFPPGVFNLVQGGGDVGRALVAHPDVDGVLFTGSWTTGRAITEACLDQPHKILALEMGGKNAAVILDDADLPQALSSVLQGAFLSAGQRCTATSRVLIHRRIFDRFVDALVGSTRELVPGDPFKDDTPFGPLANQAAFERFLRLRANAVANGLEALVPGKHLDGGAFVCPSIHLLGMEQTQAPGYLDEELFGPDLCIERIDDDDHALKRLNESPYGLVNSVFTTRSERFERFYRETRSGMLNFNRSTNGASGKLPFGGVGKSGNQRPAGIDAVRYTTYPVAILRADVGDTPVEAPFKPAVGVGQTLLGLDLDRLVARQHIETLLERYRIPVDDVRGADILIPVHALRVLRLQEQVLEPQTWVERLAPYAKSEPPHVVLTAPDGSAAAGFQQRLTAFLDEIAYENPIHIAGYPAHTVRSPVHGKLPRSEALLRRMYQGDFVPRERKTPVIDLSRSEGAYLRSVDDDPLVLIDAGSQIATLGLGFQPGVFLRALEEGELGPHLLSNQDTTAVGADTTTLDEYRALLVAHAWSGIQFASFTSGGAEANEKAFDLCRLNGPGGRRVIAFEGSFHGRTLAALHATYNPAKREPFMFAGYEAAFVPFPAWKDPREEPPADDEWVRSWSRGEAPSFGDDPLLRAEIESLLAVRDEVEKGKVCAVIIEPMQGEGGDNHATARFFRGLRALTRHLQVPLIFDEVQMGFGQGGPFYWHTLFGLVDADGNPDGPDCITLAKKAQLGICLSAWPDPRPSSAHTAQAVRGLLHGRAIVQLSANDLEANVREHLWTLAVDYPSLVQNPRNRGWGFAFDLPSPHLANQVVNQRFYRGFMAYIAGDRTVRFRLNAAWTPREVRALFDGLRTALDAIGEAARDAPAEQQLEAMHEYVAPAWEESPRSNGEREARRRRFLSGEYERLAKDPPALFKWLLAVPRGPLERVCDRILSIEGQLPEPRVDAAMSALFADTKRKPGVSTLLDKLKLMAEEIFKSPNPHQTYAAEERRLGIGPARLLVEYVGARIHVVQEGEWELFKEDVLLVERSTYEEGRRDSEDDLRQMVEGEDGIALVLLRRTDHGERVLGYAFGGPVESYAADGPREDPMRGMHNTFYSANITVAAKERGAGLGLRLKRAQIRHVTSLKRSDGAPRYAFMTGRNRVGRTREMAGINHAFGAYAVEHFRGNQYGDRSGEALYYRIPLLRPRLPTALPTAWTTTPSGTMIDWANATQAPLGTRHPQLVEALQQGEFNDAVGTKLTLSNFITPTVVRYTELLRELSPKGLSHAYFTSGRDELIDKTLRCLRVSRPQGQLVIGLERQFLGYTTAAARSLTDDTAQQMPFGWYDWPKVPHPAEVGNEAALGAILASIQQAGAEQILGIVIELVGEKSGLAVPDDFMSDLAAIRADTGIPIVVVETGSALGRAGPQLFASDALSCRPNFILWYTGAQLGHIFVDDAYYIGKPLTLISTWDGDEISLIRTRHHLVEARRLLPQNQAARFEEAVRSAGLPVPVRGRGLTMALELETHERAEALLALAHQQGLRLERGLAGIVMMSPPLNVTEAEMLDGFQRLRTAFRLLES